MARGQEQLFISPFFDKHIPEVKSVRAFLLDDYAERDLGVFTIVFVTGRPFLHQSLELMLYFREFIVVFELLAFEVFVAREQRLDYGDGCNCIPRLVLLFCFRLLPRPRSAEAPFSFFLAGLFLPLG